MKPVPMDHKKAIKYEAGTPAQLDVLPYWSKDGYETMLTLWQPSPEEPAALNVGKPVRLHIIDNRHPFVKVDVEISD